MQNIADVCNEKKTEIEKLLGRIERGRISLEYFRQSMESLEDKLFAAISKGDLNDVSCCLSQGAYINIICTSGRTPLGVAAEIGNTTILKKLLESCSVHGIHSPEAEQQPQKKYRSKKCRREMSESRVCGGSNTPGNVCGTVKGIEEGEIATCKGANLGYFIMVHKEGASNTDENRNKSSEMTVPSASEVRTPEGMDGLEWDTEVMEDSSETVDDSWASLYRWYADILDRTGSLLQKPHQSDFNHQDIYGRCAVHYAAEQGHIEALRMLKAAGCHLDVGDKDNRTPLHLAASRDHYNIVRELLHAGVEVNRKTSDKTSALHIAACRGFTATARVLLEYGASVDSLDSSDRTPLLLAVLRGRDDVVELLLQNGAKVNIEEIHGYTPLCEAVWQKRIPLVQILLDAGAKITQSHHLLHFAVMHRQLQMVELLLKTGSVVNLRDDNGDSPLIVAARTGCPELAEVLLKNGASVNYPNALTGSTPLHEAIEYIHDAQFPAFESMFKVLRSYGAILNILSFPGEDTPLFRALLLKKFKAAALLIRYGSDVNMCDIRVCGVDILKLARKQKHAPLVRMIIYAGFDIQKKTPDIRPASDTNALQLDIISDWLTYMKYNPMHLTDLCRIVLRKNMSEKILECVSKSYLPQPLKRYLLLEDIEV